MTTAEVFERIYREKLWGDGSGGGSAPGVAGPWAAIASKVIADLKPNTVLDIGCGDGWASAKIDLAGAKYIGVDAVASIIEYCQFRHDHGEFRCVDALTEELPGADLVLLKEVTQHLSDASVLALIEKLRRYPAVLHCSAWDPGEATGPIADGGYRPVGLYTTPWRLPAQDLGAFEHGGTTYHVELWRPSK